VNQLAPDGRRLRVSTPDRDVDIRRLEDLPAFLTLAEAAAFLRLGRTTVWECVRRGQLPAVRLGRRLRIPRGGLLRLAGEQSATNAAEPADDQQEHDGNGTSGPATT
jgi:excisionase family DNA binding protein